MSRSKRPNAILRGSRPRLAAPLELHVASRIARGNYAPVVCTSCRGTEHVQPVAPTEALETEDLQAEPSGLTGWLAYLSLLASKLVPENICVGIDIRSEVQTCLYR